MIRKPNHSAKSILAKPNHSRSTSDRAKQSQRVKRSSHSIRFASSWIQWGAFMRSFSCASVTLVIIIPATSNAQEKKLAVEPKQTLDRISTIETRLNSIEARLGRIESALFASVRFSEAEARKQLVAAKSSLKNSEKLYAKGLLSAFQIRIDRFNLERAEALHRLCVDHEDHRKIGATMELYDAKSELEQKRFRLNTSEAMFERGFLAREQIEVDRRDIAVAEQKLAAAQAKLKAMESPKDGAKPNAIKGVAKKKAEKEPKK